MVFIIDDDHVMAECIALHCQKIGAKVQIFHNAIEAIGALNRFTPDLIFLDILLDGPNGFTFLNEVISYQDTAKIPIVIISSLQLQYDLSVYHVVGVLDKSTMLPQDVQHYVKHYLPEAAHAK